MRERLLPLYQNIIKVTEGDKYVYRFGLADALLEKKQFLEAYNNYHAITKSLDLDIPTDLKPAQDALAVRQQLALDLKKVASGETPAAAAEAAAQDTKIQELNGLIAQLTFKQAQERKAQEDAQKAAEAAKKAEQLKAQTPPKTGATSAPPAPNGAGTPVNIAPGSSSVILPTPSGAAPTTTPAPITPVTPAPSSQPKSTPPAGGPGR